MKQQKRVLIISIICILISLGFTIYFSITPIKAKYEYHIILTNDSVFVFDRYNKQIGKYKPTNPKEQFDSILLLDNL